MGIKEYLQQQEVQERIQRNLQQARSNVTVSISRAASLFGFSESQLREWEKRGLLTSERGAISQAGRGHRQYTTDELSKLAVLQELFKKGNYAPSDIPPDFEILWEHIGGEQYNNQSNHHAHVVTDTTVSQTSALVPKLHIDQRVERAEQEVFWRYFTAQVLRLSLMLICENTPDIFAGLILPLEPDARFVSDPQALSTLGEVLIGWQDKSGSFDTFLDSIPSFEHPSDFRIEPLQTAKEETPPLDSTMIVIQRKAESLDLTLPLVQTIRQLLRVVYDNVSNWKSAFSHGMRDYLYQATDFRGSINPNDDVLNKLMETIISIGGKSAYNTSRNYWRFCCLLLPEDADLPLQKHSLVIRSQSSNSPYKVGVGRVSVEIPGLSLRAYQSGNIIYRPDISAKDLILAYYEQEQFARSAIALPITKEDGVSIAVLYIASEEPQAFPIETQRVLRLIGIMIEELLLTYQARQQVTGKRTDLLDHPCIVDPAFKTFLTENDFIHDVETLLATFLKTGESSTLSEGAVSFIAVDIDNQSTLASQYGDRIARNLSREVGMLLRKHLNLFAEFADKRLYHINADRYYLLLDGMSLEDARTNAEQIRIALQGKYIIDSQHISSEKSRLPDEVTVRLGVTSYTYQKIKEILQRYDANTAVAEFRALITQGLDLVLDKGRREGGNVIITWDYAIGGYRKWRPNE
jgi:GGDEF domain-containing protein